MNELLSFRGSGLNKLSKVDFAAPGAEGGDAASGTKVQVAAHGAVEAATGAAGDVELACGCIKGFVITAI